MLSTLDGEQLQQFAYTIWYIWSLRNKELHGEKRLVTNIAADRILQLLEEFNEATVKSTTTEVVFEQKWTCTLLGLVKINFDVAYDKGTRSGGVGVIIRDSDGFVLAATALRILNILDAFHAEVNGSFSSYTICS
ncbi:hypothetical protein PTKIN_Ptkin12aG0017200 [Pterospermum kingtungense]